MSFTTHAAQRAAERYGLTPTAEQWSQAVLDIIESCAGSGRRAALMGRVADGKERWLVTLGERAVIAIYCPASACIITVAPNDTIFNRTDRGRVLYHKQGTHGRRRRERERRLELSEHA